MGVGLLGGNTVHSTQRIMIDPNGPYIWILSTELLKSFIDECQPRKLTSTYL